MHIRCIIPLYSDGIYTKKNDLFKHCAGAQLTHVLLLLSIDGKLQNKNAFGRKPSAHFGIEIQTHTI